MEGQVIIQDSSYIHNHRIEERNNGQNGILGVAQMGDKKEMF